MSDKLLSDWLVRDPGSNTPLLNPQYGQVLLTQSSEESIMSGTVREEVLE